MNPQNIFVVISDLARGPAYFVIAFFLLVLGWKQLRSSYDTKSDVFRLGWRLSTFWTTGILLNTALKYNLVEPRPWWINSSCPPLHPLPASGYGMPSGHAQSSIGILILMVGLLSWLHQSKPYFSLVKYLIAIFGLSWVILVGFSRIYLHAHSIEQVIAGAGLGLLWALIIAIIEKHDHGVTILTIMVLILSYICLWQFNHSIDSIPESYIDQLDAYSVKPPTQPPRLHMIIFTLLSLLWVGILKWYKTTQNSLQFK